MKIMDLINYDKVGFFQKYNELYPGNPMTNEKDPYILDYMYIEMNSGTKKPNMFLRRLSNGQEMTDDNMRLLCLAFNTMHGEDIARIFNAYFSEYNAIHNYDRTEQTSTSDTGTVGSNETTTNSSDSTSYIYGFQSNEEGAKDTRNGSTGTGSTNGTTTRNLKTETTSRISGNIGLTKTQEMINDEKELRKNSIYDYIFEQLDNMIALSVYDNDEDCYI